MKKCRCRLVQVIHSFIHSPRSGKSCINSLTHSFIHSFFHSLILSFIHSCIHLFIKSIRVVQSWAAYRRSWRWERPMEVFSLQSGRTIPRSDRRHSDRFRQRRIFRRFHGLISGWTSHFLGGHGESRIVLVTSRHRCFRILETSIFWSKLDPNLILKPLGTIRNS